MDGVRALSLYDGTFRKGPFVEHRGALGSGEGPLLVHGNALLRLGLRHMETNLPAPILGALLSSSFAVATALYSLHVARQTKKTENTRSLIRHYFSTEFMKVRREATLELKKFWVSYKADPQQSFPLVRYLTNRRLHEYVWDPTPSENGLSCQQNTLLFLYFWAELEAYRKLKQLDIKIVRAVLPSQ